MYISFLTTLAKISTPCPMFFLKFQSLCEKSPQTIHLYTYMCNTVLITLLKNLLKNRICFAEITTKINKFIVFAQQIFLKFQITSISDFASFWNRPPSNHMVHLFLQGVSRQLFD